MLLFSASFVSPTDIKASTYCATIEHYRHRSVISATHKHLRERLRPHHLHWRKTEAAVMEAKEGARGVCPLLHLVIVALLAPRWLGSLFLLLLLLLLPLEGWSIVCTTQINKNLLKYTLYTSNLLRAAECYDTGRCVVLRLPKAENKCECKRERGA
jgi:hypothetical protein